jgi:hypothetical protein
MKRAQRGLQRLGRKDKVWDNAVNELYRQHDLESLQGMQSQVDQVIEVLIEVAFNKQYSVDESSISISLLCSMTDTVFSCDVHWPAGYTTYVEGMSRQRWEHDAAKPNKSLLKANALGDWLAVMDRHGLPFAKLDRSRRSESAKRGIPKAGSGALAEQKVWAQW